MADRLTSIRKQIAALEKEADELRKGQNGKVIAQIRQLIDKYELHAVDLGFEQSSQEGGIAAAKRSGRAAGAKRQAGATVGVPKYRDPKSGKTWTGCGKPPAWIASARDRTRFLIDDQGSADTT
jgi:DNA-binding protein H-NS